ncbi:MAG: hypothetical protein ACJASU_002340 [Cognaticolwellia sp.]|jgi:hypothetical protein
MGQSVPGGFILKECNEFKNFQLRFIKILKVNLYFKNPYNNSNVAFYKLDSHKNNNGN